MHIIIPIITLNRLIPTFLRPSNKEALNIEVSQFNADVDTETICDEITFAYSLDFPHSSSANLYFVKISVTLPKLEEDLLSALDRFLL